MGFRSVASATEYDGIWFLGFNVQKPPFDELKMRQAVAHGLDRNYIVSEIISEEIVPASFIPPGLPGYDASLLPLKYNTGYARLLMKRAKYLPNDPRLGKLSLLHTDGVKTIEIAKKIQRDLKELGFKISLVEVSYRDAKKWEAELKSGRHQLFLLGQKPNIEQLFSDSGSAEKTAAPDGAALLEPLFKTGGPANFGRYSNSTVDMLFDQLSVLGPGLAGEREIKLRAINKILYKELPAVVLFYIEKL